MNKYDAADERVTQKKWKLQAKKVVCSRPSEADEEMKKQSGKSRFLATAKARWPTAPLLINCNNSSNDPPFKVNKVPVAVISRTPQIRPAREITFSAFNIDGS
jgi:hypothetical protein